MALAKKGDWGHPVGKAAATWSLCPELTLPTGVAGKVCDGSTCMVVCEPGKVAMGRRRIKCRWKRSKGFFGNRFENPELSIANIIILKNLRNRFYYYLRNYQLVLDANLTIQQQPLLIPI